jgi:hypothetical protein
VTGSCNLLFLEDCQQIFGHINMGKQAPLLSSISVLPRHEQSWDGIGV